MPTVLLFGLVVLTIVLFISPRSFPKFIEALKRKLAEED
jgi:hypothetical protein